MLGVLKRRWKPKRAAANNNNNNSSGGGRGGVKPGLDVEVPMLEKHRAPTSPRQIHPVCEEKMHLVAYEGDLVVNNGADSSPVSQPGGGPLYPLTPNICVEGGRIEFIKPLPDTATSATLAPSLTQFHKAPIDVVLNPPPPPEKADIAKEQLEARVLELEAALETERKTSQRERLMVAKLQRQLARREVLQRDVDRERRLRLDSESRLRNSASEAERCRARLAALQREFSRMEETVRSMLQYKSRYDQLKQDKHQLTLAYENRVQQFQNALSKLNQENEALKKQLHTLEAAGAGEVQTALVERLRILELDNSSLTREGDVQRRQYERCLDDVANQVVRALLAQKSLREEISTLQQRVRDLETQNRSLTSLLLQQLTSVTSSEPARPKPTIKFALPAPTRPVSCEDTRLRLWQDSVVWLPLQRPSSLTLDTCCPRPPVPVRGSKEEDEGSESPESGNRDEGYSTMSSDVQGLAEVPRRGLEELKEASDETDTPALPLDTASSSPDRLPEPDMVLIPLSLALSVGSAANRHSFPPVKDLLPFQHVMRSFSDSHLCLKLAQSASGSSYSLASAESVLLLERQSAPLPLRRARLATSLPEEEDDCGSWCSGDWWDADYVQHWLRLDETRSALQQQMEYDAAELEDWSMEEEPWRREPLTHSQTLPSIQESIAAELEEDSSECLWNSSSYLVDQLTVPDSGDGGRGMWPYGNRCLISPGGDSWSSAGTNSEDGRSLNDCVNGGSKRSSTAMSTDSGELPAVGTDFTRDFYRLVKFESTKSLASTSSRSQAGESTGFRRGDIPVSMPLSSDREQALQSVLHFIAEQQQYVLSREVLDTRPSEVSLEEMSPDYSEEFPIKETSQEIAQISEDAKCLSVTGNEVQNNLNKKRPLSSETLLNEYNATSSFRHNEDQKLLSDECCKKKVETVNTSAGSAVLSSPQILNGPLLSQDSQSENNVPIDKSNIKPDIAEEESHNRLKISAHDKVKVVESVIDQNETILLGRGLRVDISRSGLRPVPEEDEDHPTMSESFTSTISTPETVLKAQLLQSSDMEQSVSVTESIDSTTAVCEEEPVLVNGPKTISFHEKATSKDVIDELNRMIRKGEDNGETEVTNVVTNLDMACCCPTGWVHVERDIDFTDPKARANLLDVMLAASHSSSSASSSSSNSSSSSANNSDSGDCDEPPGYQHLHRLHRFRRQKKASATREPLGALRCPSAAPRPSIIGREDFFVRYGDKEREAVASFDFLEELSTTSVSGASSGDQPPRRDDTSPSSDGEHRHLSFSDSCAASFSGSEHSLDVHQ